MQEEIILIISVVLHAMNSKGSDSYRVRSRFIEIDHAVVFRSIREWMYAYTVTV